MSQSRRTAFVAPWPGIVIQILVLPALAPVVTRAAGRR